MVLGTESNIYVNQLAHYRCTKLCCGFVDLFAIVLYGTPLDSTSTSSRGVRGKGPEGHLGQVAPVLERYYYTGPFGFKRGTLGGSIATTGIGTNCGSGGVLGIYCDGRGR